MAMATPADTSLECPICNENFDQPKILPCTHLACKKCVLSWLSAEGSDGGCPLCRAPILSTRPAQGQLAKLVDALPTNFAVQALVESQQVLALPHVCNMCEDAKAKSYCLQCDIKLCRNCVKGHNKIPSLKNHKIENLTKLTLDRLAETNRTMCKTHPDRLVEMFCPAHKEVICLMCASTRHKSCTDNKFIADAAAWKRAELKDRACALRQSEAKLAKEIRTEKDVFKAVRKSVKDTFDDIQKTVDSRRQELEREIQTNEGTAIKSKDTKRASLASNANTLEQLVSTAPQVALLAMADDLTSRLDQLQSHTATTTAGQLQVPEFTVDDSTLRQLKSDICSLGRISMTSQRAAMSTSSNTASPQSTSSGRASHRFAPYQNVHTPAASPLITHMSPASPLIVRMPPASFQNVRETAASSQNVRETAASSQNVRVPAVSSQNVRATPASSQNVRATPASSQNVRETPASSQNVRETHASSLPGPKPRRAELARVLKVGDRVKPGPNWSSSRNPDQGTVTAIPSKLMAAQGWNPSGCVDVSWDGEGVDLCHLMGDGVYELDLV